MQQNGSWRLVCLVLVILLGLFAVSAVLAQGAGRNIYLAGVERTLP